MIHKGISRKLFCFFSDHFFFHLIRKIRSFFTGVIKIPWLCLPQNWICYANMPIVILRRRCTVAIFWKKKNFSLPFPLTSSLPIPPGVLKKIKDTMDAKKIPFTFFMRKAVLCWKNMAGSFFFFLKPFWISAPIKICGNLFWRRQGLKRSHLFPAHLLP